jgi:D-tyrosyl-tRNA(Tyr) deacylase
VRVVVQRVAAAEVVVGSERVATIGRGLLLLVGLATGDGEQAIAWMARKIAGLRVFDDDRGFMNASLAEVGGRILAVPQFTLLADYRKGKRPSFSGALAPVESRPLFERFVTLLKAEVGPVATGRFGASMQVRLVNDGPVTLVLER